MPGMRRREFVSLFGGAVAAWPLAARAQQPSRLPTIGLLGAATASAWRANVAAFVQRLSELGWADSRTIAIVYRWANGRPERFTEIAAEFVQRKVDVIVTAGTAVGAAKQATRLYRLCLQRPRSRSAPASSQVLRVRQECRRLIDAVDRVSRQASRIAARGCPRIRRVAILAHAGNPAAVLEMSEVQASARAIGLPVVTLGVTAEHCARLRGL